MKSSNGPRKSQGHLNSNRLVFKELFEIRKGLNRYSIRATALARDVEARSRSRLSSKIVKYERGLQQVLDKLEERVGKYV